MIPVSSSNIAAVGYDGITLIHSGREYAYYVIFLTNSFVYKLFTVTPLRLYFICNNYVMGSDP